MSCGPTAPTPTPTSVVLPGDLNLDSQVDELDEPLCVNLFMEAVTDPGIASRADIRGDSADNVLDVQIIVNLLLKT